MSSTNPVPTLGEAAGYFLSGLSREEREISQQEIFKFVRWFSWNQPFTSLTAPEVAHYAEQLSLCDAEYEKKLVLIRAFLIQAKKENFIKSNLASHLKTRKGKTRVQHLIKRGLPDATPLTQEGRAALEAELATLKSRRIQAVEEVRRAAADKDFRENAPLEAAREQLGHLEGRIRELEEVLKSATPIDQGKNKIFKVGIGDSIILSDLASGEELRYSLVSPREVNPSAGKISNVSPLGKAISGRSQGEVVEISVPAGKLRYLIKHVER